MSNLDAIILGIIQGLTEFLPVSSSGHLVLFQKLLGIKQATLLFDTFLHIGTLIAVIAVFWRDIIDILKKPLHSRLLFLIIVGTIPTGILGIALKKVVESSFSTGASLGIGFIITAVILWYSESVRVRWPKKVEQTGAGDAFFIGIMQGLAVFPAFSRSGFTIAGSLFRGLDKKFAAKFSFMLSIPAILGAALVQVKDIKPAMLHISPTPIIIGVLVSAIVGYISIKFMIDIVVKGKMKVFSYYLVILGILILLDQFVFRMVF